MEPVNHAMTCTMDCAHEIAAAVRSGVTRAVDAVSAALDRIERTDPALSAFTEVWADEALRRAAEVDAEARAGSAGPLAGVPFAVKGRRGGLRAADARALAGAGAIPVGATSVPGPGTAWQTWGLGRYGRTVNPWRADRTPGGSSAGAAAAVAAGLVPLATGADGAGSIRIPAAWCGVLGLKTTNGRLPVSDPTGLTAPGVLARCPGDAALYWSVVSGAPPGDPLPLRVPPGTPTVRPPGLASDTPTVRPAGLASDAPALRPTGLAPSGPAVHSPDPAPRAPAAPPPDLAPSAPAPHSPNPASGAPTLRPPVPAPRAPTVPPPDPAPDAPSPQPPDPAPHAPSPRPPSPNPASGIPALWSPDLGFATPDPEPLALARAAALRLADLGVLRLTAPPAALRLVDPAPAWLALRTPGADPAPAHRLRATNDRRLATLFSRTELLLTPAVPLAPHGHDGPGDRYSTELTWAFNLSGHPAITLPAGFDDDGCPAGLQLVAPHGREDLLLAVARQWRA
ncbi:amidase family protein [Streptomyces sp. NPDC093252]|uniref:amidase family protein n=1 Tax=Streptomyces sp. NPDC093252 TaxID=3154980 RepID=UPI00343FB7D6